MHFLERTLLNLQKKSLWFIPWDVVTNMAALPQIMGWRRSGDRPLSEQMMVSLLTFICVTRWVNTIVILLWNYCCWTFFFNKWKKKYILKWENGRFSPFCSKDYVYFTPFISCLHRREDLGHDGLDDNFHHCLCVYSLYPRHHSCVF